MKNHGIWIAILALAVLAFPVFGGLAQEKQTANNSQTLPPSTNPTNRAIYPAKGQSNDQQMQDQLDCYNWATQQTGWDPYKAHDKLVQQGYVAKQTADQAQGGAVRGAARGALVGVAVGAIAGDAGKGAAIGAAAGGLTGGMRSRRTRQSAQSAAEQTVDEFNRQLQVWERNFVACMTGHGYTVN